MIPVPKTPAISPITTAPPLSTASGSRMFPGIALSNATRMIV